MISPCEGTASRSARPGPRPRCCWPEAVPRPALTPPQARGANQRSPRPPPLRRQPPTAAPAGTAPAGPSEHDRRTARAGRDHRLSPSLPEPRVAPRRQRHLHLGDLPPAPTRSRSAHRYAPRRTDKPMPMAAHHRGRPTAGHRIDVALVPGAQSSDVFSTKTGRVCGTIVDASSRARDGRRHARLGLHQSDRRSRRLPSLWVEPRSVRERGRSGVSSVSTPKGVQHYSPPTIPVCHATRRARCGCGQATHPGLNSNSSSCRPHG